MRGLAPLQAGPYLQPAAGPSKAALPSWEVTSGDAPTRGEVTGGAGGLDRAGESLAYLLSTADGGLDVSRLYALAMDAHGADDLAGRVRDKADSIKQRMRERREFEDVLKEAAALTVHTELPAERTQPGTDPQQQEQLVKQLGQAGASPTDVKQGAEGEGDLRSIDS